ncbi:prepilin-type N-terminal cleavage/methylation domain-containing protein [Chloroflexota bacterium]
MRRNQNGFTVLELVVVLGLSAIISLIATSFTFQAFRSSAQSEDYLTAVSNVENAGFWLSRDGCIADVVITDNLTSPAILTLKWTDWGYGQNNIYHSAIYSIKNLSAHIGQLTRQYQSSDGTNLQMVIAGYIYYNADDLDNNTTVTYESPILHFKVATRSGNACEVREYQV